MFNVYFDVVLRGKVLVLCDSKIRVDSPTLLELV